MKIRIEMDGNIKEEEIIIRCSHLSDEVKMVQEAVAQATMQVQKMVFYQGEKEFYFSPEEVLFFETEGNVLHAHTRDGIYRIRSKLYELEETLPGSFMRVSKSAILNVHHVYSIERNLTASSIVQFQGTHKQVFVSRHYYKALRERLEEKRYQAL